MVVGTLDLKTVRLRPELLYMRQAKDMTLFQITHQELFYMNRTNPELGIRMLIVLKRKVMSEMMTTFFPSILLTLITFATTLFKPIYFEASLSVNLTTMLVMTTIFISKMEGLPPTSDTKMIDMWLILCQLVPFIEVMLVTAIEFYKVDDPRENNEGEDGEEMNMSMILADLYSAKMDMDIPVEKEEKEESKDNKEEEVGVMSTNEVLKILNTLREKHNKEGLIVPHLHFIGLIEGAFFSQLFLLTNLFSEEKIVPGAVVFLSLIYFSVALVYYYED